MKSDMNQLNDTGTIDSYNQELAGIMIPCLIQGVLVCAFVDTGATLSIISGRVARILASQGARIQPTRIVADTFGNGQPLKFNYQIGARVAMAAGSGFATFQVLENMEFDCIIGDDILKRSATVIDYGSRTIGNQVARQRMLTKGEALTVSSNIQNAYKALLEGEEDH